MKDMMTYKGFVGSVHYSDEDRVFHGKTEFVRSLISLSPGHAIPVMEFHWLRGAPHSRAKSIKQERSPWYSGSVRLPATLRRRRAPLGFTARAPGHPWSQLRALPLPVRGSCARAQGL